jgi:phosphohistidine phosphatase
MGKRYLLAEELMQLYLVQHAASKSESEDPQRSLTDEGRQVVEQMAKYLSLLGFALDRIEHSDKLRARQTAEILAARLQPREGTKQVTGIGPNDHVEPMRERLQTESKNLMLVGHLPYLSRLVAMLLGVRKDGIVVEFRMGGVVRLDRKENGEWVVCWAVTPELLPALATRQWDAA